MFSRDCKFLQTRHQSYDFRCRSYMLHSKIYGIELEVSRAMVLLIAPVKQGNSVWNLSCGIMIGQRRDETDDCIRKTKAHSNQIRVGHRRKLHKPINAPAHLFDDAFVSE